MHLHRLVPACALATLLLLGACGDDDGKDAERPTDAAMTVADAGAAPTSDAGTKPTPDASIDAGLGLDGSLPDLDGGPDLDRDSAAPDSDASTQPGDAAASDGGTHDAASNDAASSDAASAASDAASDSGRRTADGGGPCDIDDPRFGCGTVIGANWVRFESGLEIDRLHRKAWSPVIDVFDDDELVTICSPLELGGLTTFDLPQMDDVRTLAAGCAKTAPGGSCSVTEHTVTVAQAGDCTCSGGTGPNHGKFCRPEVPDCETLWSWTHTDETGVYQHWFYDVDSGSIVTEAVGQGIAVPAKGRCVLDFVGELP